MTRATDAMTDQDWLKLYFQASTAVMTLWTVYVAVVGLIVGYVANAKPPGSVRCVVVVAFLLFVLANGYPLLQAQSALVWIRSMLSYEPRAIFTALSPWVVGSAHCIADILVLSIIIGWPWVSRPTCLCGFDLI